MTASDLEIRAGCAADDELRDRFVRSCAQATFFHLAGWRRAVERVMGHRPADLLAFRSGQLVGVLPMMQTRGLLGAPSLISMPYAVYGGPAAVDGEVERALVEEARALAEARGVRRLELRCRQEPGLDLTASSLYATFVKELPTDPAQVLAGMPKKARAEARKARERHGLELDEGVWFTPDLVRLFHRNKRSLGSPGLPARMFHTLLAEFPGQVVVHLVRQGPVPLAAVMSFVFGDTLLAYYSGTAEGADRATSASNFMYMALQEWCVVHGYRFFDFGRSRRDSGAFRFKLHQGFEPQGLEYRYLLVKDRTPPSLNPSNPRTRVLREAWRRLPLWLATRLAGRASRYLP